MLFSGGGGGHRAQGRRSASGGRGGSSGWCQRRGQGEQSAWAGLFWCVSSAIRIIRPRIIEGWRCGRARPERWQVPRHQGLPEPAGGAPPAHPQQQPSTHGSAGAPAGCFGGAAGCSFHNHFYFSSKHGGVEPSPSCFLCPSVGTEGEASPWVLPPLFLPEGAENSGIPPGISSQTQTDSLSDPDYLVHGGAQLIAAPSAFLLLPRCPWASLPPTPILCLHPWTPPSPPRRWEVFITDFSRGFHSSLGPKITFFWLFLSGVGSLRPPWL